MKSQSLAGRIVVVGLAFTAVSCATASRQEWVKGGAGPDDLARDRYACMQESRVSYSGSYGGGGGRPPGGGGGWGGGGPPPASRGGRGVFFSGAGTPRP